MTTIFTAVRIQEAPRSSVAVWSGPKLGFVLYALEPGERRLPHPRIPAGTYPLRLRTVGEKNIDYATYYADREGDKFPRGWHRGMVEICDVPGRTAVLFHVGNWVSNTLGCSLAGLSYGKDENGDYCVTDSRRAYERAYPIFRDAILAGPTQLVIKPVGAGSASV